MTKTRQPNPPLREPLDVDHAFLTTQELAEWLKVSRYSIYRYIQEGLPHYRLGPHHRFKRVEVEVWMKQRADGTSDGTLRPVAPILNPLRPSPTHSKSIDDTIAQLRDLAR